LYPKKLQQCHVCALRLQKSQWDKHQNMHYKEQVKLRNQSGTRTRTWNVKDWVMDVNHETDQEKPTTNNARKQVMVDENFTSCQICHNELDKTFDEMHKEWFNIGCVYADGKTVTNRSKPIVHYLCYMKKEQQEKEKSAAKTAPPELEEDAPLPSNQEDDAEEEMDDEETSSEEESSDESDSATEIILFSDDEEEQQSSQREAARLGAIMEFKIDDQEEEQGPKVEQIKKEVKQEEIDSTKVTVKTETKAIDDKVELENPKENEEMEVEPESSEPKSGTAIDENNSETK